MSLLSEKLKKGEFVVTSEVGPPKGTNIEGMLQDAKILSEKVQAINVTDLQSSVMRVGSLAISKILLDNGLEPVYQLTCRDRNRLALQSDLLNAFVFGIQNVLCLTGDHTCLGDHPETKPVFDLDSISLLQTVLTLESGKDLAGNDLDGSPTFFKGAVVAPAAEPVEPQLIKMEKKIAAGAQFFQTQAIYVPKKFEDFMQKAQCFGAPVLLGVVLLKSSAMAKYMNENVAGVSVPDEIIKEMDVEKKDRKKKSVEIAVRLINEMKPMCQGIHFMPLGWESLVPDIINEAGL
ncbi:MAG: methylenetetrahydrofolate reductase [Spirochaetaceae bacterium]|nr:MAG: methylenetetrahydrofolate reductase [Spirochaetaceae bacterium]